MSPYIEDTDYCKEKKIIKQECGRVWLQTNIKLTPELVIERINQAAKKAADEGFVNIIVATYISKDEWDNEQSYYLVLMGERVETDKEYKDRIAWIKSRWKREYEEFLQKKKLYSSERGLAILKEIE